MPKEGYSTFTVKDECYMKLHLRYNQNKNSLRLNGINSFSEYLASLADNNPTDLDDIKELLCINNQILITMFDYMLGYDKETCQTNQLRVKQHMFEFLKKFQNE